MESDNFTRHYIIRYLSARDLVLPPTIDLYKYTLLVYVQFGQMFEFLDVD